MLSLLLALLLLLLLFVVLMMVVVVVLVVYAVGFLKMESLCVVSLSMTTAFDGVPKQWVWVGGKGKLKGLSLI